MTQTAPRFSAGLAQPPRRAARRLAVLFVLTVAPAIASAQLTGELGAHDPSTLSRAENTYVYFATGPGIVSRTSSDLTAWNAGPSVFSTAPAWTTAAVPGFDGTFWAPDVIFMNGLYHLYYSVSTWGSKISAIGLATSPSIDPAAAAYAWTDRGAVIQSNNSTPYNAIDASLFQDSDGRAFMAFGSYSNGIYISQINPATGKTMAGNVPTRVAASSNANNGSTIEGSALIKKGDYYYLFVNYGTCCSGVESTYNIRVGRGTSPTGPFFDKSGTNLVNAGGTLFLDDDGNKIGPGHFSLFSEAGQDRFGYHYYDGNRNGAPTYGLRDLYWTSDAWPSIAAINPDWTGSASTSWSNVSNWSDAVPDAPGAVVNFRSVSSNRYTIALDGAPRTLATMNFDSSSTYTIGTPLGHRLTLDATDAAQATLNVANGSHVLGAPVMALDPLGINVTPLHGTLTLQGSVTAPSLQTYGNGTVVLAGVNAYSGTALLHDGTLTMSGSMQVGGHLSVGAGAGDVATLRLTGTGSLLAQDDLNIGDTGSGSTAATGTLELRDAASITVGPGGGFFVGSGFFANTRALGTVNQSGGTLIVNSTGDGSFIVGGRTSTRAAGVYNLSGGTVNANTNIRIGGRGDGTVNQSGGTFNTAGFLAIGRYGTSEGAWNISAGSLNHTNASTQIIVGESGTGTLTISGSALVSTPSAIRLGHATGGSGTLNLNGGILTAASVQRGPGLGHLRFDGGTLRAAGSSTAFLQGLTTAVIGAGGATIDSNSFNLSIGQSLTQDGSLAGVDGGLTKTGNGQLTLLGANSYTGATTLNAGTITFSPAARNILSNAGGLVINAGSVLFEHAVGDSPAESIRSLLAASHASGFASGQIRSAALGTSEALGWKQSSSTQVLVALTRQGDANLDFAVNFDDLLLLAQHYGSPAVWEQGDFTYDGLADFDDLLMLAQQYGTSAIEVPATLSMTFRSDWVLAQSLVPEPGLAAVFAPILVLRRRTVRD